ncbi:RAB11a, member RAS oncogene family, like isoform X1 [Hoplias malabaricus]|uniref:RAB11a, member RAS oncogene family, like isoform X1 n=1 Tax=Hoplias malabaricus TaxID=27720 RepID=UPI003461E12D
MFNNLKSEVKLNSKVKATIITGMCEGLCYLHSKDIVHQDLKPDNIMVEHGSHRVVIIDMGLAKFFVNGRSSAINLGNMDYSSPEVRLNSSVRDKRSDVWAMGKIIAELILMKKLDPYNLDPNKIREYLKDYPCCNTVSKMVTFNASERASMAEVFFDLQTAGDFLTPAKRSTFISSPSFWGQSGARETEMIGLAADTKWSPTTAFPPREPFQSPHESLFQLHNSAFQNSLFPQLGTSRLVSHESLTNSFQQRSTFSSSQTNVSISQRHYERYSNEVKIKQVITRNEEVVKREKEFFMRDTNDQ